MVSIIQPKRVRAKRKAMERASNQSCACVKSQDTVCLLEEAMFHSNRHTHALFFFLFACFFVFSLLFNESFCSPPPLSSFFLCLCPNLFSSTYIHQIAPSILPFTSLPPPPRVPAGATASFEYFHPGPCSS